MSHLETAIVEKLEYWTAHRDHCRLFAWIRIDAPGEIRMADRIIGRCLKVRAARYGHAN